MRILISLFLLASFQILATDSQTEKANQFANKHGCPMDKDEKLICEALMCNPMGLAIAESRSECLKVNRRLAVYLSALPLWEDPRECMSRDKDCNVTGKATRGDSNESDNGVVVYRDENGHFRDYAGNYIFPEDENNIPDCNPRVEPNCECKPGGQQGGEAGDRCEEPRPYNRKTSTQKSKPKDTSSLKNVTSKDVKKIDDLIEE